jgi:hypothetical protein
MRTHICKRSYTLRRKHREEESGVAISAPRSVLKIESSNFLMVE